MNLITGCARSGTSLTTAILAACGARLGNVNVLNEHGGVRDGLVKPYIQSLGADPLCQNPLPTPDMCRADPEWREKVLSALNGADTYKGAKACHVWPLWGEAFPEAKWIIVRRDRDDIVSSCLRTGFMRAFKTREGWERWVDQHLDRFDEMRRNLDCVEVWPHDGVTGSIEAFRLAVEHCGLTWDAAAAARVVDRNKWHAAA